MIKVDVFVNGRFWRMTELPGLEKHFQVKVVEKDNSRSVIDFYVEDANDLLPKVPGGTYIYKQHVLSSDYFADIVDPSLEIDIESEYCLKRT